MYCACKQLPSNQSFDKQVFSHQKCGGASRWGECVGKATAYKFDTCTLIWVHSTMHLVGPIKVHVSYTCVYVCTCLSVCVHVCTHMGVFVCAYVCVSKYLCVCRHMYTRTLLCVCTAVCACMFNFCIYTEANMFENSVLS